MPIVDEQRDEDITAADLLDKVLVPFSVLSPDRPAFEVAKDMGSLLGWHKELCVTGLIEREYVEIMDLYQLCNLYQSLPSKGGVLDQEPKMMEIFQVLKSEELKFEKIRSDNQSKKKR